ncbi:hypothetical protein ACO0SA_000612 [Hanseniaspora valbyensis]
MSSKLNKRDADNNEELNDLESFKKSKSNDFHSSLQEKYDQTKILSKLEETRNLLKEIEDEFEDDEFDNLLSNPSPSEKKDQSQNLSKFVELTKEQLAKMSELERINYELQRNASKFEHDSKKFENLNMFVADKEEEERMDNVRKLQEPNVVIHDLMGYNAFFNLLFIKLDSSKLKSILTINSAKKLMEIDLQNFLVQKEEEDGTIFYNEYTDEDLQFSFKERQEVYTIFEEWLADLKDLKENGEKTVLLKTVILLQVLFILANDLYHNNMKYQNCFNDCFDLNNCLYFIEREVPLIFNKLNNISNNELNQMNFFSTFLNANVLNDYHIQLFLQLDKLPLNIIDRFKENYYCGDDFELFIKQNILIKQYNNKEDANKSVNLLALDEKYIKSNEAEKDSLLKRSIENLKSCQEMEENDLVGIIRCVRMKNFFMKKRKDEKLFKQLSFVLGLITSVDSIYYKKLAKWIRDEIHKMKVSENITNNNQSSDSLKSLSEEKDTSVDIDEKSESNVDNDDDDEDLKEEEDDDVESESEKHFSSNYYGFSKESLPDVYIRRYLEAMLITCDIPETVKKHQKATSAFSSTNEFLAGIE